MKSKILILVMVLLLLVSFGTACAKRECESPDSLTTIYVVPPITDVKILPTTSISDSYISNDISIVASPGEYEPASFVIHADEDITSLEVEATDLTGPSGSIPSDNVDIRVVKVWYQTGWGTAENWDVGCVDNKFLTPELLLKDDSLVKVEGEHNYLKVSGEYIWISEPQSGYALDIIPIDDRPIKDSPTLQPVDIPNGTNKQFWITVRVPDDSVAGVYTGTIELRTTSTLIGELQLELEVLPIELSKPYLTYSLYYRARLKDNGSISSEDKNEEQLRAELENMVNHGVTNPNIYSQDSRTVLGEVLTIRNEVAMDNQSIYVSADTFGYSFSDHVDFVKSYGTPETEVYFYGVDEGTEEQNRLLINLFHAGGAKAYVALGQSVADSLADILDLVIAGGDPSISLADEYHNNDNEIFSYANPQVVPEFPETFRKRYGLLLWQRDYDGAMDYAYQHSYRDIWNDFDTMGDCREHVFAYPTIDGVIDTVQWEGFREGVDDIRYLTTLLNTIETAKGVGKDTSSAESWLADLKSSDLTTKDLDVVRSEMIDHICGLAQ